MFAIIAALIYEAEQKEQKEQKEQAVLRERKDMHA